MNLKYSTVYKRATRGSKKCHKYRYYANPSVFAGGRGGAGRRVEVVGEGQFGSPSALATLFVTESVVSGGPPC